MNYSQPPMFRLDRKPRMKYQLKSIIIGLSIVLVILLVYICTLPSYHPDETKKLKWLQNIIDENTKRKLAMKNLYKPKINQQEPSLLDDPFWFITSTSSYPTSSRSSSSFKTSTGTSTSAQTVNDKMVINRPLETYGLSALPKFSNFNLFQKFKQMMDAFGDDTSESALSTTSSTPSTSTSHERSKNIMLNFPWKHPQSSFALMNKLETQKERMIAADADPLRSETAKEVPETPKEFVKESRTGSVSGINNLNPLISAVDPRESLKPALNNDNFKDTAYKPVRENLEPFAKPKSYIPGTNSETQSSSVLKNYFKTKNNTLDVQKNTFTGSGKSPLITNITESTNIGLAQRRNQSATIKRISGESVPGNIKTITASDNNENFGLLNNKNQSYEKSLVRDSVINKPSIEAISDSDPKEVVNTIVETVDKLHTDTNPLIKETQTLIRDKIINKPVVKPISAPDVKDLKNTKISEKMNKNQIQKTPIIKEAFSNLQTLNSETKSISQNNGLIQNISTVGNSRIQICTWDISVINKVQSSACVPLQTVTAYVKICTYPLNEDSGVSTTLRASASWEFTMARDLQLALLKDKSNGLIHIGAGIGVYSVAAASLHRPVIAIEPYMPHVRLLQKSAVLNKVQQYISVVCNAVSNVHEVLMAEPVPGRVTEVNWKYVPNMIGKQKDDLDKNMIETITLDDLVEVINLTSAVLKIDVPKYDVRILKSAYKLFNKVNIRYVFMHWKGRSVTEIEGLVEFFVKIHYRALDHLHGKEVEIEDLMHRDLLNVVWEKKKPVIQHIVDHV